VKLVNANYGILGRTALRIDGNLDQGWGTPRLRGVLATLLVHVDRRVPIETLLAWAWPEGETLPQKPMATYYTYATRIRGVLRRLDSATVLHVENGCYRLEVDKSLIDYTCFRTLIGRARELARERAFDESARCAQQGLGLWRGRALDDLASEPARAWRTRVLRDEWLPANVVHIEALLQLGEFGEALNRIDELKEEHDLDVTLVKLRLSTLQSLARYSDATAYYLSMRRLFLDDADDQAAEDLRAHFESLRVSPTPMNVHTSSEPLLVPRQLPHDIGDFVGRADMVEALDTAMRRGGENLSGVVVIDGMAGVGKTALAVHWAHRVRHLFSGGDFFVNLNGFSESASLTQSAVVDEFLVAVGYPLSSSLPPRGKELMLKRLMADRRALVVLDNARGTDHVKDIIALLPSCSIVVTSRQRLTKLSTGTGVRRVHVDPLSGAETAKLFSTLLGSRSHLDPTAWARLAALCGGLPLVITVLAQHVASQSAAHLVALAQRLDRRRLLTDIGEDGDGSATAETFFLWSYQALDPAEQRLLRLLGANPGKDIAEDTVRACDGRTSDEVRRSLRILVAAHLLEQPDAVDRYHLHDLIREFARRRAELDDSPASQMELERRLLGHYLSTAISAHRELYPGNLITDEDGTGEVIEAVTFESGEAAKSWFDRERGNLVAAIHLAASRGYHEHAWRLTDIVGTFLDRHGYYDDSRMVRQLSVASARAAGHRVGESSTLVGLGMVQIVLGEHNSARENLEAALHLVETDGNERGQASTLFHLGRLELMRGDPGAAVEFLQRCLGISQRIQDSEAQCWTHCSLAEALRTLKRHEQALTHLRQGQFHARRIGDMSAYATSMVEMGLVYRDRGEHVPAVARCEQALEVVETMPIPDLAIETSACIALAEIHNELANVEAATRWILRGLQLTRRTHNVAEEAHAQDVYGDIQFTSGDPDAVATWRHAADLYMRLGNAGHATAIRNKEHQRLSIAPGRVAKAE
jgi:tetratricopeptide (TPR) repeat protein/DNA-binding SARP family transcriptional activator